MSIDDLINEYKKENLNRKYPFLLFELANAKENDHTLKERIRIDYESMEGFVQMLAATGSKIYDFQLL